MCKSDVYFHPAHGITLQQSALSPKNRTCVMACGNICQKQNLSQTIFFTFKKHAELFSFFLLHEAHALLPGKISHSLVTFAANIHILLSPLQRIFTFSCHLCSEYSHSLVTFAANIHILLSPLQRIFTFSCHLCSEYSRISPCAYMRGCKVYEIYINPLLAAHTLNRSPVIDSQI